MRAPVDRSRRLPGFSLLWFQQQAQAVLVGVGTAVTCAVRCNPAADMAELDAGILAATRFIGEHGVMAFASSGLRMAAEDLVCRRRGVGLADLIGRRRDRVSCYQTGADAAIEHRRAGGRSEQACARAVSVR